MDAFQVILTCLVDLIKLVFVVACIAGAYYYGYSTGWRDSSKAKKAVRREKKKLERLYY